MSAPAFPPIGGRLRDARRQRGMTVRGLARAVDVSASLISQIETGKSSPSVSTLYAMTSALGVSIEDVFGDPESAAGGRAGGSVEVVGSGNGTSDHPDSPTALASVPQLPATGTSAPQQLPAPASSVDRSADSPVSQGLRMLQHGRRVGPVVRPDQREILHLDSGVTWELLGKLPDAHTEFLRITYAPGGSSSGAGVLMRHQGTEYGHVLSGRLTLSLGFDTYVLNPGDSVSFDCSTPHGYANHGTEPAVGVWFVVSRFG